MRGNGWDLKSKTFGIDGQMFDKSNEGAEPHARKPVIYLETPSEKVPIWCHRKDPITLRIFPDKLGPRSLHNGNALDGLPGAKAKARKGSEISNDGGATLERVPTRRMNLRPLVVKGSWRR